VKFYLPKKKPFYAALKINRWPVNWFDDKKKLREEKERKRQDKIKKLYPKT